MWVEQAIFTSLPRQGKGGYHLVSRSPGIGEAEARGITTWSPSHGGLLVDANNRVSVNFHPLSSGRFALSRSCEGPPEYSGRGGRQVYTHALLLSEQALMEVSYQPFDIYRNALALGILFHQFKPPRQLETIELPRFHIRRDQQQWFEIAREQGMPPLEPVRDKLLAGRAVRLEYNGDRAMLVECLIGSMASEAVRGISFASSLQPSSVRPFLLSLVAAGKTRH